MGTLSIVIQFSGFLSKLRAVLPGESADRSRMWMQGPIQWINLAGWRKLEAFEVHAMFVFWRELSLMLGCKWVPNTLEEFRKFRDV